MGIMTTISVMRTPDAQPAIAMEGGAADRKHSGEGQGEPTPQGTTGGGYHGVGGGRGGLAALHHKLVCCFGSWKDYTTLKTSTPNGTIIRDLPTSTGRNTPGPARTLEPRDSA